MVVAVACDVRCVRRVGISLLMFGEWGHWGCGLRHRSRPCPGRRPSVATPPVDSDYLRTDLVHCCIVHVFCPDEDRDIAIETCWQSY